MRKYLQFLFPVLFLFLFSCSGKLSDAAQSGLKGRVKYTREKRYDPTRSGDSWVAGEPLDNSIRVVHFDEEGNFLESFYIDINGDTLAKSTCRRENGDIVEEIFFSRFWINPSEARMVQASRTLLERAAEDQMNFEVWQGDQKMNEGANYYDKKGRLIRQVYVLDRQELTNYFIYEKNLLVEKYQENIRGERSAPELYEYDNFDDHGNWMLKLIYYDEAKISPDIALSREIVYY
jgi:hypothetical protein